MTALAGYQYPPPTQADFHSAMARVLGQGEADQAWAHAMHVASVEKAVDPSQPADLVRVAKTLIQMGGLRAVVGNSMYVRLLTYEMLAKRSAAAADGGTP